MGAARRKRSEEAPYMALLPAELASSNPARLSAPLPRRLLRGKHPSACVTSTHLPRQVLVRPEPTCHVMRAQHPPARNPALPTGGDPGGLPAAQPGAQAAQPAARGHPRPRLPAAVGRARGALVPEAKHSGLLVRNRRGAGPAAC